ncbi:class E sortase [Rubrobacter indicoceani]|uniref:class E sortase n=1 Tax=Rubrobacter indicoceani TaxID=2051957 RepID=UPI001F09D715|nr:class E sortase [Rubrobacter indicoceani]
MSLVLVVAGLGLVGSFFFGTPVAGTASAESTASTPDDFNVPVIAERQAEKPADSDPENLASEAPENKTLSLSVPQMSRLEDAVVPYAAGSDEESLRNNAGIHLAGTGFPWEKEANVYIAGHRLGYPNTSSFLAFFDLNKLENGDEVTVQDANGTEYTYRVFRSFTVLPTDVSVTEPIEGKNILTLQTCTLPDYTQRLIVQAEKVETIS